MTLVIRVALVLTAVALLLDALVVLVDPGGLKWSGRVYLAVAAVYGAHRLFRLRVE